MAISRGGLFALILANLVPLAGVIAFDWNLYTLMTLYWSENMVVGAFALAKIGLAKNVGPVGKTKLYKTLLFTAFYGTFVVLHGSLLSQVVFRSGDRHFMFGFVFAAALFGLLISHGVSLKTNFFDRREHEKLSAFEFVLLPFPRVVPMHVVLIVAAVVALALDEPHWAVYLFIPMKILLDLVSHLAEHTAVAKR